MNLLDLSDKLVLLAGGGAIGRVIVKMLAAHGARVAVNDMVPDADAQAIFAASGIDLAICNRRRVSPMLFFSSARRWPTI